MTVHVEWSSSVMVYFISETSFCQINHNWNRLTFLVSAFQFNYNCLINYSENCFVQKFKTGKNFWWYGVEFVFLSFVEKPQCNQVVLCLSVSCLPNKKTEQEVFVFGKKVLFLFFLFFRWLLSFSAKEHGGLQTKLFFSTSSTSLSFYMCFERDKTFHLFLLPKFQLVFFTFFLFMNFV